MSHYCGIDLHSNNHFVVVIDDEDRPALQRRLPNDLALTLNCDPGGGAETDQGDPDDAQAPGVLRCQTDVSGIGLGG